ncbi:MAG: DndE family protein [Gemmataceae bacterium]
MKITSIQTVIPGEGPADPTLDACRHRALERSLSLGLLLSLHEPMPPTAVEVASDVNVELTWQVLAGDHAEWFSLVQAT